MNRELHICWGRYLSIDIFFAILLLNEFNIWSFVPSWNTIPFKFTSDIWIGFRVCNYSYWFWISNPESIIYRRGLSSSEYLQKNLPLDTYQKNTEKFHLNTHQTSGQDKRVCNYSYWFWISNPESIGIGLNSSEYLPEKLILKHTSEKYRKLTFKHK